MKFCQQLSAYYPDKSYGGQKLYQDMVEQAILCDTLNYDTVALTEHHLINILLMPAPLQMAVKIATLTQNIKIMIAVSVLPLHDMRVFAGELVVADILTDGRLMVGVGKGAFAYEQGRMGIDTATTREKFDESLNLLLELLSKEEVSAKGDFYNFEPLTIMPRPMTKGGPPLMMAVLAPPAIFHCTKRGFHIQTTPLSGNADLLKAQVEAFTNGKKEREDKGKNLTLSLSQVAFLVENEKERQEKLQAANRYYSRFDNVFTGPGIVENGMIKPLPRKQTQEELAKNLLICTVDEMVEKLTYYENLGIDRLILNMNFGASQEETCQSIEKFAKKVMPHFQK